MVSQTARIRELFVTGTEAFNRGNFGTALERFKEAYRVSEQPVFWFNIAQCHRRMNDKTEAVLFYKAFVQDAAHAPKVPEVRANFGADCGTGTGDDFVICGSPNWHCI